MQCNNMIADDLMIRLSTHLQLYLIIYRIHAASLPLADVYMMRDGKGFMTSLLRHIRI